MKMEAEIGVKETQAKDCCSSRRKDQDRSSLGGRNQSRQHFDFRLLASRTGRE